MDIISTDADMMRGLGCAYGHGYLSLDKGIQIEISQKMTKDNKFAQGLGLGLGHRFNHLPKVSPNAFFELGQE